MPGIGRTLAQRISEELEVSTLQELEQAAHDGRLERVEGFGPKRVRNIQISLAGILSSAAQRSRRRAGSDESPKEKPDVWAFTARYSNTARAHELGKTDDWVVLYYQRNGEEDQATVVTETQGVLEGKRVVRGREAECRSYYQQQE